MGRRSPRPSLRSSRRSRCRTAPECQNDSTAWSSVGATWPTTPPPGLHARDPPVLDDRAGGRNRRRPECRNFGVAGEASSVGRRYDACPPAATSPSQSKVLACPLRRSHPAASAGLVAGRQFQPFLMAEATSGQVSRERGKLRSASSRRLWITATHPPKRCSTSPVSTVLQWQESSQKSPTCATRPSRSRSPSSLR